MIYSATGTGASLIVRRSRSGCHLPQDRGTSGWLVVGVDREIGEVTWAAYDDTGWRPGHGGGGRAARRRNGTRRLCPCGCGRYNCRPADWVRGRPGERMERIGWKPAQLSEVSPCR